ncbi:carboxylesterase family protein [Streptomyces sp. R302]|uniref:carboxylesterase/lipase family protein n=1 Tax=unclassified Streptomyces TaxID=2593676 RepID=UPI00145D09B7|nr:MULTISPECIES: carboxylesterase family protein [unclassified Streptomyces]NML52657.1 carboxylesterase family protein [Streptomyces sp. R301]NML80414.1 carboxylesterase family protein [Streptomyces sp. R302]
MRDDVFETAGGSVRGFRVKGGDDVVAVLGIPYAAPPFGADRFREPRPAPPWSGVRDGTEFGPVAPQSAELPGAPNWSPGDEDVLTVNVWTPAPGRGGRLPVLVWLHGGAYTFGSSAQPDFDGTALARAGLVVVTVNYRLGFEGFGHVPDASPDASDDASIVSEVPDNRGLLDQIAALRWVRDNIHAFGGDPDDVTLAGQSSGATSVVCLMVMDRARGLFHRAIAHSPASPFHTRDIAAATAREIAAAAGCPATWEGLASATPQALVAAADQVVDAYRNDPGSGSRHYDPSLFAPVLDGDTLPTDPLTALAAGAARDVDLLLCHTTEEYWLLDAVGSCAKLTTEAQLARFARDFGLSDELLDAYRSPDPALLADDYLALFGDLLFVEFTHRLAEAHAAGGGRTYLSRFDRRRERADGTTVHAWHCADIPFAFGNLDDAHLSFLIGGAPTPEDHALSRRMAGAWAAFATTGNPGWDPIRKDDTEAGRTTHVWTLADRPPADPRPVRPRDLWAKVAFPLLHP